MNEAAIITLLVWNVHGLPCPFLTGGTKPSLIVEYLKEQNLDYDFFFAQEVWTKKMKKALNTKNYQHWVSGAGLLTVAHSSNVFRVSHHPFEYTTFSKFDFLASKGFSTLLVPIENSNILFINTHLDSGRDLHSEFVRMTQVEHIIEYAKEYSGPIVLVGDLNLNTFKSKRDSKTLKRLLNELNLRVIAKNGLDYVLGTKEIPLAVNIAYLPKGPSDHQPILVSLVIK